MNKKSKKDIRVIEDSFHKAIKSMLKRKNHNLTAYEINNFSQVKDSIDNILKQYDIETYYDQRKKLEQQLSEF